MEIIDSTASLEKTSVKQVVSDDVKELTSYFRALLSGKNPPIQQVIDCGVVPCLIRFLQIDENAALQIEAVGAIANIASSGSSDHIGYLVDAGVVPTLIRLLSSGSNDVREQVVMALGNISGNSAEYRDMVLTAGALPILLEAAEHSMIIRHIVGVLSNLCCIQPTPPLSVAEPALPLFARFLFSDDVKTREAACHTFKIWCSGGGNYIQAVLQVGVTPRLVELIQRISTKILSLLISTSSSDASQLQFLFNDKVLDHPDQDIMIIAGDQIQAMIDGVIFPKLFEVLKEEQDSIKKEGVCIIYNSILYGNSQQVMYLIDEGVIRVLSSLLQVKDLEVVRVAVGGLETILQRNKYDYDLLEGVVKVLCEDNNNSDKPNERDGMTALKGLQIHNDKRYSDGAKSLIELIFGKYLISENPSNQLRSLQYYHNILTLAKNPPIQQVIDCGVVPCLIRFLQIDENAALQVEATGAIAHIASSRRSDHIGYLVEIGVIPVLIRLLSSGIDDVRTQAARTLGLLGDGNNIEFRDIVLAADALPALLEAAETCKNEVSKFDAIRQIVYALSCLCRGRPLPDLRPALPLLSRLLSFHDEEILKNACSTLFYISLRLDVSSLDAILQEDLNIISRLMEMLLGSTSTKILVPALKVLANIASGNERQTQSVIVTLPSLLWLLDYPDKGVHVEVCWTLSNITGGATEQIQAVIDAAIFPKLFQVLKSSDLEVQKEAGFVIANATAGGTTEQIWYLINEGVIPVLCRVLENNYLETYVENHFVKEILLSLSNILDAAKKRSRLKDVVCMILECNGKERITKLQNHKKHEISTQAKKIIKSFEEVV